jgi:hypothetical protein
MLVDPPILLKRNERGPFNGDNMLHFMHQRLPERLGEFSTEHSQIRLFDQITEIVENKPQVFLDSDKMEADGMLDLLVGYTILGTWQHNLRYLEDRLDRRRHEAIASPSLDSFAPLTSLRRNVADIEDAIRAAKDRFAQATKRMTSEALPGGYDAKTQASEAQYDVLLEQVKTMSTLLNNEIQLVIGSVTVQVPELGPYKRTLS